MASRVPQEFVTTIKNKKGETKEYVMLAGLLELAHSDELKMIKTQLLQIPTKENHALAIAHACVETKKGTFEGTGDASPASVKEYLVPHLIRMAETRAVARALRFATNVAMTALEELGSDSNRDEERLLPSGNGRNGKSTPAQLKAIYALGKKQGWSDEELKDFIQGMFNVSKPDLLDKSQASTVISELQELKEEVDAPY